MDIIRSGQVQIGYRSQATDSKGVDDSNDPSFLELPPRSSIASALRPNISKDPDPAPRVEGEETELGKVEEVEEAGHSTQFLTKDGVTEEGNVNGLLLDSGYGNKPLKTGLIPEHVSGEEDSRATASHVEDARGGASTSDLQHPRLPDNWGKLKAAKPNWGQKQRKKSEIGPFTPIQGDGRGVVSAQAANFREERPNDEIHPIHSSELSTSVNSKTREVLWKPSMPLANQASFPGPPIPATAVIRQVLNRAEDCIEPGPNQEKGTKPILRRVVEQREPVDQRGISKKIHILGTGVVGRFLAYALIGIPEAPPVTLLLHRPLLLQQWHDEGGAIRLIKDHKVNSRFELNVESSAGFHADDPDHKVPGSHESSSYIIENLIVTTNGATTISALAAIKWRLRNYSTICFIQDGLGVIEQVNSVVFPRRASRPSYILGNISHDLHSIGSSFTVMELRPGNLSLTIMPASTGRGKTVDFGWTPRSKYLIRTLCRTPELQAAGLLRHDFFKMQLEKLAINSVIGPLSVVNYCTNDQLLYNYQISRTMKMLLKEISRILRQLPEVSRIPNIDQQFSPERLESLVVSVIDKTGKNRTSMLQAVMDGKKTDIDFYNGYLLSRAAELGIKCPTLEMIVAMVKGKQMMQSRVKTSYVPFTDE